MIAEAQRATLIRSSSATAELAPPAEIVPVPCSCSMRLADSRYVMTGARACCSPPPNDYKTALPKPRLALESFTLSLFVSRDEEYVRLELVSERTKVNLGARNHNFLLLVLARQRLADAHDDLPETARGWVYTEDLVRGRDMTTVRLNLDVFRIRMHVAQHGVAGAKELIERRTSTRQLRIGTARLAITPV